MQASLQRSLPGEGPRPSMRPRRKMFLSETLPLHSARLNKNRLCSLLEGVFNLVLHCGLGLSCNKERGSFPQMAVWWGAMCQPCFWGYFQRLICRETKNVAKKLLQWLGEAIFTECWMAVPSWWGTNCEKSEYPGSVLEMHEPTLKGSWVPCLPPAVCACTRAAGCQLPCCFVLPMPVHTRGMSLPPLCYAMASLDSQLLRLPTVLHPWGLLSIAICQFSQPSGPVLRFSSAWNSFSIWVRSQNISHEGGPSVLSKSHGNRVQSLVWPIPMAFSPCALLTSIVYCTVLFFPFTVESWEFPSPWCPFTLGRTGRADSFKHLMAEQDPAFKLRVPQIHLTRQSILILRPLLNSKPGQVWIIKLGGCRWPVKMTHEEWFYILLLKFTFRMEDPCPVVHSHRSREQFIM